MPQRGSRARSTGLVAGVIGLVVALIAGASYLFWPRATPEPIPTTSSSSAPEPAPNAPAPESLPTTHLPTGTLPSLAPLPRPEAITQLAAQHGLDCVDEEIEPWKIVGCYRWEPGRIATARFKLTDDAEIEKFQVTLLDHAITQQERSEYVMTMAEPVLDAMEVPGADVEALKAAVADLSPLHFKKLESGIVYVTHDGVAVLGLSPHELEWHPFRSLGTEVAAMLKVLGERGYSCFEPEGRFECLHPSGASFSGATWEDGLLTASMMFPRGVTPSDPYDPRLLDTYAALEAIGPEGRVLNEAVARVVIDRSKHAFVDGFVVDRWEGHITFTGVDFP
ncbi:MAG: hypothetical protein IPJ61_05215 [Tessaracoccus sp.]|uniref:hypothetical protein n=1 Tax=Tessaracoccus sp. TaxID=1971211 RepID=UPI001EC756E5|nr:hypothetical protein [Tessaracoccus sp.]MBK7820476.1 hypothetical protein [Tessaracoccus sp.]